MEERTKEQVLGDLYALRAGLSLISQEYDEVNATDRETEKAYDSLVNDAIGQNAKFLLKKNLSDDDNYMSVADFVSGCSVTEGNNPSGESEDNGGKELIALTKLKEKNGVVGSGAKTASKTSFFNSLLQASGQTAAADNGASTQKNPKQKRKAEKTYFEWVASPEGKSYYQKMKDACAPKPMDPKTGKILMVIGIIAIVLSVASFIGFVIACGISGTNEDDSFTGLQLAFFVASMILFWGAIILLAIVGGKRNSAQRAQEQITAITALLNVADEKDKSFKELESSRREKLMAIMDVYSGTYSVLLKEYSSLIDERDWKYLDLIIFYLETGRADTKKEALQLVEREIQTQRIVDSVKQATYRIVDAIAQSAQAIGAQLNYISRQLGEVLVMQSFPALTVQQNYLLHDEEALRGALLSKAKTGSEQLVKDLQCMRTYRID